MCRMLLLLLFLMPSHLLAKNLLLESEFTESAFDIKQDITAEENKNWALNLEVGATIITGNTKTQTFKSKFSGTLILPQWRLSYFSQTMKKTDNGEKKVDKWKIGSKFNWDFSDTNSSFATIEYGQDKFSSFGSLGTFAAGYTQRIYQNELYLWDADIGPGIRWSKQQSANEHQLLYVLHLGTNFKFPLSKQSDFEQILVSDLGLKSDNVTVIRSESTLTASILANLKMKFSYTLRHNSKTDAGKEKLDSQSSVTLLMVF